MKKPRLFVSGDEATDDTPWFCGGPDVADAAKGLANSLEHHIRELLESRKASEIWLSVKMLTDAEVADLPEP